MRIAKNNVILLNSLVLLQEKFKMKFKIQNLETLNDDFVFDGANINALVDEFHTPLYVYSTTTINKKINELNEN